MKKNEKNAKQKLKEIALLEKKVEDIKKEASKSDEETEDEEIDVSDNEPPEIEPPEIAPPESKEEEQKYLQVPVFLTQADKDKLIYENNLMLKKILQDFESSK